MIRIQFIALGILMVISASGQSKSERKKNKVKSLTEWETVYENGKPASYKAIYEEFDKSGRSVAKTEFGRDGAIQTKTTSKYDTHGNKTEETEFDAGKKKNLKRTFRYNAFNDKTEELEYDGTGTLVSKTLFTYNGDGDKTSETILDASGKVQHKTTYTYNTKKLKTGRQTVNKADRPESGKKWEYVYY